MASPRQQPMTTQPASEGRFLPQRKRVNTSLLELKNKVKPFLTEIGSDLVDLF